MDKPSGERVRSQPASPSEKGKGKGQVPRKGNRNQDQAGSPDEQNGQRKLNDFGIRCQRVQFVGDVHVHDDGFESPRGSSSLHVLFSQLQKTPWANVWMCQVRRGFQACRRVRSHRAVMNNLISQRERCFSPLDVETMVHKLLTLEVLCPRAQ